MLNSTPHECTHPHWTLQVSCSAAESNSLTKPILWSSEATSLPSA